MTIEAWNIVLSAVILVLMVGGGIWLKYVVDQQLKGKDVVVEIKNAQISSLQRDTAPAIARAYADMREHANQITEDYKRALDQIADLTKEQQASADVIAGRLAMREAKGLIKGSDILEKHLSNIFPFEGSKVGAAELTTDEIYEAFSKVYQEINTEIARNIVFARDRFGG